MSVFKYVLGSIASGAIVALAIYITPLKHINLIEPSLNKVDVVAFQENLRENSENYLFIDVRSESSYKEEHAEGSINMPIHTLFSEHEFLPKDKTIVLICTGGALSAVAYHYLEHQGFLNLGHITGGLVEWKEAGLPTDFN